MELQELTLKELTSKYSDDYFDDNMIEVLKYSLNLLQMVQKGSFEYDTFDADRTLYALRYAIDEVDI